MTLAQREFLTDEGPGRFELMLSVFDRKQGLKEQEVSFRLARCMPRELVEKTLSGDGWFRAVIFGAKNVRIKGQYHPDVYELTGETLLSGENGQPTPFRGIYNCHSRNGTFWFNFQKEGAPSIIEHRELERALKNPHS